MALGVTLADLVHDLRAEVGHSLNPAQGVNTEEQLMYLIDRVQQQLWVEFDWPMKRGNRYVYCDRGQNFLPYPADMPFTGIVRVHWAEKKSGANWKPLEYNINILNDFTDVEDDLNTHLGEPQRWDNNPSENTIQLWPIPDRDIALRLHGVRDCLRMRKATDKCELDSVLLVMRAAAEVAARQKMADAQVKMQNAQVYAQRLLAKQRSIKREPFVVGGGSDGITPLASYRPGIDYIP